MTCADKHYRVYSELCRYRFCCDCGTSLAHCVDDCTVIDDEADEIACPGCYDARLGRAEKARIDAEDSVQQALWFVERLVDGARQRLWERNLRTLAVCGELRSLADAMRVEAEA